MFLFAILINRFHAPRAQLYNHFTIFPIPLPYLFIYLLIC